MKTIKIQSSTISEVTALLTGEFLPEQNLAKTMLRRNWNTSYFTYTEDDKGVTGFILYKTCGDILYIEKIKVRDDAREQGIASSLLAHIITKFNPPALEGVIDSTPEAFYFWKEIADKCYQDIIDFYIDDDDETTYSEEDLYLNESPDFLIAHPNIFAERWNALHS